MDYIAEYRSELSCTIKEAEMYLFTYFLAAFFVPLTLFAVLMYFCLGIYRSLYRNITCYRHIWKMCMMLYWLGAKEVKCN